MDDMNDSIPCCSSAAPHKRVSRIRVENKLLRKKNKELKALLKRALSKVEK
jgi:hypothetical protein